MCEAHASLSSESVARRGGSRRGLAPWARVLNTPFIWGIWVYRMTLSPLVGRYCRFSPTCSQYALEAYRTFGPWRATCLTLWRLVRCQPLARGGYDPVPIPVDPVPVDDAPNID